LAIALLVAVSPGAAAAAGVAPARAQTQRQALSDSSEDHASLRADAEIHHTADAQSCALFLRRQAKLVGSDTVTNDNFGFSVATYGSTAIVGAHKHDSGNGAAYVFVRSRTGKWKQQAELHPPSFASGGAFGFAVALYGKTAAVSAPFAESDSGVVAIYTRIRGHWKLKATKASSPGVEFGWSLGLFRATLVVGAPGNNAAFIFLRTGAGWTQRAVLTPSDSGGDFGESVSITGGAQPPWTIVVGAPSHNNSQGAAYVFRGAGSVWTQTGELSASDGAAGDQFGWAVANSGASIAVGAPDISGTGAGEAYVYVPSASGFVEEARLTPQDGVAGGGFGELLTIYGGNLVVTAPLRGSVYAYQRSQGVWSQRAEIARPGLFGDSAYLYRSTLLIGNPSVNASAGAVYVYRIA
jgi:hypothetical protein